MALVKSFIKQGFDFETLVSQVLSLTTDNRKPITNNQ